MEDRNLVTSRLIDAIRPIADADAIEAAVIGGWTVVVKKGEYTVGDEVLYFEIDSLLPLDDERFAFLAPRGEKIIDGTRYHRLKTARLRGVYSQGLALPMSDFASELAANTTQNWQDILGVIKYDPPIPADQAGEIVGPFPSSLVQKTDAERVQNLDANTWQVIRSYNWLATEKIDGMSVTYINDNGTLRVCSRNWELANTDSLQWRIAEELHILDSLPVGWSLQGEIYGEGIQNNRLKIKGQALAVFAVRAQGSYTDRNDWPDAFKRLAAPAYPISLPRTIAEAVEQADGIKSLTASGRLAEGIVWHTLDGSALAALGHRDCFKVISNKYLSKESE